MTKLFMRSLRKNLKGSQMPFNNFMEQKEIEYLKIIKEVRDYWAKRNGFASWEDWQYIYTAKELLKEEKLNDK